MAYSTDDLAAIRQAISTGELEVQYADRRVTYRSMDDLLKAEKRILNALNGRPKQHLAVTSKGF